MKNVSENGGDFLASLGMLGVLFGEAGLLVNPTARLAAGPVLCREAFGFVVLDVSVHELMKLVEVEEGNHRIRVMFHMEVGIPKQLADEPVGLDGAGILEAVHLLADLAVGMLEVTNVVDRGVSDDDGDEPPEGQGGEALLGLTEEAKDYSVDGELLPSGSLETLHQTRLGTVGLCLHGPATAGVVDRNAAGRVDDAEDTARPGRPDVEELLEVGISAKGDIPKAGSFELLAAKVGGELGILVDIVGEGMVLLVHEALVGAKLEADTAEDEENVIVVPFGFEGIAMQKFMLSSKGEGLELESIEQVEGDKDGHLVPIGEDINSERIDLQPVDGVGRGCHNGQVFEETLEALIVRLLHQLEDDAVGQDAIALLALGVLDVGPVLGGIGQIG